MSYNPTHSLYLKSSLSVWCQVRSTLGPGGLLRASSIDNCGTYPGSLYVSGYSPYAPSPLSSYTSLPQLSPPSYQYGASLGYVDNTLNTSVAAASSLSSFSSSRTPGPGEDRGGYPSQPFNLF